MPTVTCSECPTTFDIAPSHLKRLKREPTCSPACKQKSMRGKGHWHWRGGSYVDAEGYRRVHVGDGQYEMEHRRVMAKKLGRPLKDSELVRHKNGDRLNNKLRNLELFTIEPAPKAKAKHATRGLSARTHRPTRRQPRRVVSRAR